MGDLIIWRKYLRQLSFDKIAEIVLKASIRRYIMSKLSASAICLRQLKHRRVRQGQYLYVFSTDLNHNQYILWMEESHSKRGFEMTQLRQDSPSETSVIDQNIDSASNLKKSSAYTRPVKYTGLIVLLIIIGFFTTNAITTKEIQKVEKVDIQIGDSFKFRVYCPFIYFSFHDKQNEDLRRLYQGYQFESLKILPESIEGTDFNITRTYVVFMKSRRRIVNGSEIIELVYCSFTRIWNGTCNNSLQWTCSSPGPMFDLNVGESVDIVWVNLLNPLFVPDRINTTSCISNNPEDDDQCTLHEKINTWSTFYHPTDMMNDNYTDKKGMRIGPLNWPTSTHVHGAEIRPTFDGNPLSWTSNSGKVGPGTQSIESTCYFDNFEEVDAENRKYTPPNIKFSNNMKWQLKIHRYPNLQNPGNLWYHDHSMRLTQYNAVGGLTGIYILRDTTLQANLPTGQEEGFIMRTMTDWETRDIQHKSGVVYRYRILNNDQRSPIIISFAYGNCSNISNQRIPFNIIGADSSLVDYSLPGITKVELGSAERIEILIEFKETTNFQICSANPTSSKTEKQNTKASTTIKTFSLKPVLKKAGAKQTTKLNISESLHIGAPFTDLSLLTDEDIAIQRMRPLILADGFRVNGHFNFHKGQSENPEIGTVEDWYIINTIGGAHPIHVHLINYQVVEQLQLRVIQYNSVKCPVYQLDFYLQAIGIAAQQNATVAKMKQLFVDSKGVVDYLNFCTFFKKKQITINEVLYNWNDYIESIEKGTYSVNVENQVNPGTKVSGIDVRDIITDRQSFSNELILKTSCPTENVHKYICGPHDNQKPWYRKWKDTSLVDGYSVFKYRIRWTKSDYTNGTKYFNVPIDQLRQFPGYVYHCHILGHQDNEMMRSIMLEPPKTWVPTSLTSQCNNASWEDKYQCLNQQCQLAHSKKNRLLAE